MSQGFIEETAAVVPTTVVVIVGGGPLHDAACAAVPLDAVGAYVIAADSGLDHARAAGIRPHLVVGDFDSVSDDGMAWARAEGVEIETYPTDKNFTDTELALAAALARGASDIVMLGGGGDRLDHTIGALGALGNASLARCRSVLCHWGDSLVYVLHGPRRVAIDLSPGTTFSLLTLHGACMGVGVTGACWPLNGATLDAGSSLGVSNIASDDTTDIFVRNGVLTVIVPHHFAPNAGPS